jgi:hypothetical protein
LHWKQIVLEETYPALAFFLETCYTKFDAYMMQAGTGGAIMLDLSSDIKPLSNFKRDSITVINQLKRTGRPVVLTINGKAEVVVQDAKSYQNLMGLIERAETVIGIRKGLDSMARGEGIPAEKAFEKLRKKHKIPRGK